MIFKTNQLPIQNLNSPLLTTRLLSSPFPSTFNEFSFFTGSGQYHNDIKT